MALRCDEWAELVAIYSSYLQTAGSGVDELGRVMRELKKRAQGNEIIPPHFCITIVFYMRSELECGPEFSASPPLMLLL